MNNLIVSGAAAKIARQRIANLGLGRMRIVVEQRLGRHQEARRANAALQASVLEELLLQRMQLGTLRQPFDGLDLVARSLDPEHQARACGSPVEDYTACAAVAGQTSFLAAGHSQNVAQDLEQALARLAQEFDLFAVDCRLYYYFVIHRRYLRRLSVEVRVGYSISAARPGGYALRARSAAISNVRLVSTPTRCRRNSAVPRMSSIGELCSMASLAARS